MGALMVKCSGGDKEEEGDFWCNCIICGKKYRFKTSKNVYVCGSCSEH
jgi:hypothetical protein